MTTRREFLRGSMGALAYAAACSSPAPRRQPARTGERPGVGGPTDSRSIAMDGIGRVLERFIPAVEHPAGQCAMREPVVEQWV